MILVYSTMFVALWGAFWGYWYLRSRSMRKAQRVEGNSSGMIHYGLLGLTLLFFQIGFCPFNLRLYAVAMGYSFSG